jgi:hypothetical protein
MNFMKLVLCVVFFQTLPAFADDCSRADELRFMDSGKTLAELMSKVGRANHVDYNTIKANGHWVTDEAYTYFPMCNNQTIYTIHVQRGVIVGQDRQIQR